MRRERKSSPAADPAAHMFLSPAGPAQCPNGHLLRFPSVPLTPDTGRSRRRAVSSRTSRPATLAPLYKPSAPPRVSSSFLLPSSRCYLSSSPLFSLLLQEQRTAESFVVVCVVGGYHGLFCHVHLLPRRRLRRPRPLRRRGTSRRRAGVFCFPCDMDTKPEAVLCSPSSRLLPRVNLSLAVFVAPCVPELERLRQAPQCEQTHLPTRSSRLIVPCFVHLCRARALPRRTSSLASVPISPRCPCASNRDESFCRTDSLFQLAVLILGSSGPTSSATPWAQHRRLPCLALLPPRSCGSTPVASPRCASPHGSRFLSAFMLTATASPCLAAMAETSSCLSLFLSPCSCRFPAPLAALRKHACTVFSFRTPAAGS